MGYGTDCNPTPHKFQKADMSRSTNSMEPAHPSVQKAKKLDQNDRIKRLLSLLPDKRRSKTRRRDGFLESKNPQPSAPKSSSKSKTASKPLSKKRRVSKSRAARKKVLPRS